MIRAQPISRNRDKININFHNKHKNKKNTE